MEATLLLSSKYGFWGLVVLMNWQMIGYMMIIYIAGIQNVPEDLMEGSLEVELASCLDGEVYNEDAYYEESFWGMEEV